MDGEVVNLRIQKVVNPGRRGDEDTHRLDEHTPPLTLTNPPQTKIIHTPRSHRQTNTHI